jgi:fatty-acyl-CoA synthase
MPLARVKEKLRAVRGTLGDFARRRGDEDWEATLRAALHVAPRGVVRTLPWILRAREGKRASLLTVALANAKSHPRGLAFEMGRTHLTWSELDGHTSRVARALAASGVRKGDVVILLGENSPQYIGGVLGITRAGATASLVNHHLEHGPLRHAIKSSRAKVALVQARFADQVRNDPELAGVLERVIVYGGADGQDELARFPAAFFEPVPTDATDDFVYIFTSGTTGLPKPCRVTHARALVAGAGFGQLVFEFKPGDKLYSVLPLYHSSALMLGAGACILTRTPMAMRDRLSTTEFWNDVRSYGATAILYIGELCRYLLNTPPSEAERNNPVRIAVGNGLRADVWEPFQQRFAIPMIREFYSATEAPGVILNLTGKVGSIGHVPFRRLSGMKLARYDVDRDELERDAAGFCIECGPNQPGELLIELPEKPRTALKEFRGYTDPEATRKKILENVFCRGDRFYRSGDLMRFDENDYFYFVDRIGDTFRWKGENVSTAEVAEVVGRAPGVRTATVIGVHVPGHEGQAGLAAVECDGELDAAGFWAASQELPHYAQPRFVRVIPALSTTGTFKIQKADLRSQGVDPNRLSDPLYVRLEDRYARLGPELWSEIAGGRLRL